MNVCAGFILFDSHLQNVVLVTSSHKRGYIGFPKGVQEIGESIPETAARELLQETGISLSQIVIFNKVYRENIFSVNHMLIKMYYYLAKCKDSIETFCFNPNELKQVRWFSIQDAMKLKYDQFLLRRQYLLNQAHRYIILSNAKQNTITETEFFENKIGLCSK